MAHGNPVEVRTQAQFEHDRKHSAHHMRKQVVNFAIMIFLTLIAFTVVLAFGEAHLATKLIIPFLLVLAGIQVVLQLYSFMHLEDKETHHVGVIEFFMWGGIFIAFTFFVAFTTIIWW
jgi:cytochrome c oxidase subunit IV